jgi:hypothetical protein
MISLHLLGHSLFPNDGRGEAIVMPDEKRTQMAGGGGPGREERLSAVREKKI